MELEAAKIGIIEHNAHETFWANLLRVGVMSLRGQKVQNFEHFIE